MILMKLREDSPRIYEFFMNLPIVRFLNEWYDPISSDTRYLFHDRSEKMILWSLLVSKVD